MDYRRRIYYTSEQRNEIQDRWQRGESLSLTKPRWRSHLLCNHEIASDGRAIWLLLSHSGGQIGRDHSYWRWRSVPQ